MTSRHGSDRPGDMFVNLYPSGTGFVWTSRQMATHLCVKDGFRRCAVVRIRPKGLT